MLLYWLFMCVFLQSSIHSNSGHVGWMIDRINWYNFDSRHPIAHPWYKMCFRIFTLCSLLCMPNSPLFFPYLGKTRLKISLYFYLPFTSSFTVKHSNCIFWKWKKKPKTFITVSILSQYHKLNHLFTCTVDLKWSKGTK